MPGWETEPLCTIREDETTTGNSEHKVLSDGGTEESVNPHIDMETDTTAKKDRQSMDFDTEKGETAHR